MRGAWIAATGAGLLLVAGPLRAAGEERTGPSWSREVAPILAARCFTCHGPDAESRKAGLRLDRREDALRAEEGLDPAVTPGDPERSALLQRVLSDDPDERMPPATGHQPLSAGEIDVLRRWIEAGAVYERHWSWTKLEDVAPPPSQGWAWRTSDRFVEESHAREGLVPVGDCDAATWLRRASFALRGLPPREEWLAQVLARDDAALREALVDEMLADRACAEHWARHWLDVMRYAETRGHEFDYAIREAWRWRDWVVRALHSDLPYDRFVMEQVAGDLLEPRVDPVSGCDEAQVATGWWWLMQASHAPVDARLDEAERIDNQIDVLGKAILGTTASCARCHDHKFDDVSQRDYTALFGVARSTRRVYAWHDAHGRAAAALAEAESLRARLGEALGANASEITSRAPDNALWQFGGEHFDGWRASGGAFGARPIAVGELLGIDGKSVTQVEVAAASSRGLLMRARGALRSPSFTIESGDLWLRVRGAKAYIRAHVDGYFMGEESNLLFESHKQELDHPDEWRTRHIDLSRYVGEECWLEVVDYGDGFAELAWVASGPTDESWKSARAVGEATVKHEDSVAQPVSDVLARLAQLASDFPAQVVVLACEDGSGRDAPLYARGRPSAAGELVPRGEPEALGALRREYSSLAVEPVEARFQSASRRLEFARDLVDPAHPLTWRVAANRVWHHVMGAGLVATPDDFGVLGSPPTHPQLLDWLACRLREQRSLKALAKELVLSRTFAQRNGPASAKAAELDPQGTRLSRRPVRRLSAESIRDALLSTSGRLVEREGGPPVAARLTDFMQGRGRPEASGPQDGAGVRSLYLEVRRNFLDPFLGAFDLPIPNSPRGGRSVSNVPAQRLALMNDPFVRELAGSFAEWIAHQDGDVQARTAAAIRRVWSRPARPEELARAAEFLGESPGAETWQDWAHALFLAQETIYLP